MGKTFVAVLGIGKGTWGHVARLISENEWDKILLISNEWGKENFAPAKESDWIMTNPRAGFEIIKETIKESLPKTDLSVSLISGSGKEHMALIAAHKELNAQYQFVILTGDGVKFF